MFAAGGEMNGCTGGRWVVGTPYKQSTFLSNRLAPTIVYGMYKQWLYEGIAPRKVALNETITTAAECAAVVHRDYEEANAAVYSNIGRCECWAVMEADLHIRAGVSVYIEYIRFIILPSSLDRSGDLRPLETLRSEV